MKQSLCLRRRSNLRSDHLAAMLSSRDELPLGRRIFVCGSPRSSRKTPFCGFHKKRLPVPHIASSRCVVNMSASMYYAGAGLGLGILMVSRPTLLFTKVSHSLSFSATKHRLFLHHEPYFKLVSLSPVCNVSHWPTLDFYVWAEVSLCVTDVHRTSPLPGGS